uniref:Uncharacterized protein n=1 Tax=Acrobeloides nanus TaxID=290746 RepID=A0A914CU54_9BILA
MDQENYFNAATTSLYDEKINSLIKEEEFEEAYQSKFQEIQAMKSEMHKNQRYLKQVQNAIHNHDQISVRKTKKHQRNLISSEIKKEQRTY